jgi:hypothetical protein
MKEKWDVFSHISDCQTSNRNVGGGYVIWAKCWEGTC